MRTTLSYAGAIQDRACFMTFGTKVCSISKLFNEIGWENLEASRQKQNLMIFFSNWCTIFVQVILTNSYLIYYKIAHSICSEMLTIFLLFIQILYYIITLSFRLRYELGIIFQTIYDLVPSSLNDFKGKLHASEYIKKSPNYFNYGKRVV